MRIHDYAEAKNTMKVFTLDGVKGYVFSEGGHTFVSWSTINCSLDSLTKTCGLYKAAIKATKE